MERSARIRVCAYNVLAQNLATSKIFPSAKQALKIAKRYPLLRKRFQSIDADIVCVSEAFSDVVDMLRSLDYEVRYVQRHSKTYGNAIAWRREMFDVGAESTATFNDCADAIPKSLFPLRVPGSGVSIVREDFVTENVAMFMQFRLKAHAESSVCVCSTHLWWDPSKDPVKVAQAKMSAASFYVLQKHFSARCGGCPIIIGADLNSLPDSEVYDILVASETGLVGHPEGVHLWSVNYDSSVPSGRSDSQMLSEEWKERLQAQLGFPDAEASGCVGGASGGNGSLSFSSAYAESYRRDLVAAATSASSSIEVASAEAEPSAELEPQFTNWTENFKGCIDYLLYSNHPSLTLVDVLPVRTRDEMSEANCVGIPSLNPEEPSDHLPLAATFNLAI